MMGKLRILFLLLLSLAIASCGNNKTESGLRNLIEKEKVTKIELVNGTNGARSSIVDSEKVNELIALFDQVNFKLRSQEEITGYLYSISLYNGEKKISTISLINDKLMSINKKFYNVVGADNLKDSLQKYLN